MSRTIDRCTIFGGAFSSAFVRTELRSFVLTVGLFCCFNGLGGRSCPFRVFWAKQILLTRPFLLAFVCHTVFDVFDPKYFEDLIREGNVLYTRDSKNILDLVTQQRQVLKWKANDVSNHIVIVTGDIVKPNPFTDKVDENETKTSSFNPLQSPTGLTREQRQQMYEWGPREPETVCVQ